MESTGLKFLPWPLFLSHFCICKMQSPSLFFGQGLACFVKTGWQPWCTLTIKFTISNWYFVVSRGFRLAVFRMWFEIEPLLLFGGVAYKKGNNHVRVQGDCGHDNKRLQYQKCSWVKMDFPHLFCTIVTLLEDLF